MGWDGIGDRKRVKSGWEGEKWTLSPERGKRREEKKFFFVKMDVHRVNISETAAFL